jgi:hypothetical protein
MSKCPHPPPPHHIQQQPPDRISPVFGLVRSSIPCDDSELSGRNSVHIRVLVLYWLLGSEIGRFFIFSQIFAVLRYIGKGTWHLASTECWSVTLRGMGGRDKSQGMSSESSSHHSLSSFLPLILPSSHPSFLSSFLPFIPHAPMLLAI